MLISHVGNMCQIWYEAFPGSAVAKNPLANAGDPRDSGSIPELGRSPGGGNGNPLLYSYLENAMDRGAWWATVHGVSKSQTQLSTHTGISESLPEERKLVNGSKKAVLGINKRPWIGKNKTFAQILNVLKQGAHSLWAHNRMTSIMKP